MRRMMAKRVETNSIKYLKKFHHGVIYNSILSLVKRVLPAVVNTSCITVTVISFLGKLIYLSTDFVQIKCCLIITSNFHTVAMFVIVDLQATLHT